MVSKEVKLAPQYEVTPGPLSRDDQEELKAQTLDRLADIDPILRHIMDVKVVRNERRNFLNVRIKQDYATMLFQQRHHDVFHCFFLSDKLEPLVSLACPRCPIGRSG